MDDTPRSAKITSHASSRSRLQRLRHLREIHPARAQPKVRRFEPDPRPLQLGAVHVQPDEPSGRPDALEELRRVPAVAERAVNHDVARLRAQAFHHLAEKHRHVRPGRRAALRADVLLHLRVSVRLKLLVPLLEAPRVRSGIPDAPPALAGTALILSFLAFVNHGVDGL